jgi:Domain of unknown function (DUF4157)/Bacterial toxin 44
MLQEHIQAKHGNDEKGSTTSAAAAMVQCKLSIGAANDPLEAEADDMAEKVMRMPAPGFIQRKCAHCEEEETARRKPLTSFIQKTGTQGGTMASDSVSQQISSSRGGGDSMDGNTKSFMESRFGTDFSAVNIHTGSEAVQMSRELNAKAFTVGNDIYFNSGEYNPDTAEGKHLLAHELTHTVQQEGERKIQRTPDEADCRYDAGEVSSSHTGTGILPADVVALGDGRLLIGDFGVDWRHVNASVSSNPVWQQWQRTFERDDSYRLEIIGYTDCVGNERNNARLRQGRAQNIYNLMSTTAQSRVVSTTAAATGDYIYNNSSQVGRAFNRGVIIRLYQEFNFEEEEGSTITANLCGPNITSWLVRQMNTNMNHPAIRTARETEWPRYVPGFNLGWTYGFLSDFRALVRAGGPWDFKSQQGGRGGAWRNNPGRPCPSLPCDRTVTMCGMCFNYDVPGNIHYGWVGVAAGLRPWFLHNRAAAAQAGGVDDPKDTVAIDIGIRMYRDGTTLCDELMAHQNELNLDRTEGCVACGT